MVQISGVPSLFWNRMSDLLSPLKSPVPTARHFEPGSDSMVCDVMDVPFIVQISGVPSLFWNRMSDLLSPLKSPVPTARHFEPGFESVAVPATVVLFMVQISGVPLLFWNRMSDVLSPSKSFFTKLEIETVVVTVAVLLEPAPS